LVEAQAATGFNSDESISTMWEVHNFFSDGFILVVDVLSCWSPFGLDVLLECTSGVTISSLEFHEVFNHVFSEILVGLSSSSECVRNTILVFEDDSWSLNFGCWDESGICDLHVPGSGVHVLDFLRIFNPSLDFGLEFFSWTSGCNLESFQVVLDFPVEG